MGEGILGQPKAISGNITSLVIFAVVLFYASSQPVSTIFFGPLVGICVKHHNILCLTENFHSDGSDEAHDVARSFSSNLREIGYNAPYPRTRMNSFYSFYV